MLLVIVSFLLVLVWNSVVFSCVLFCGCYLVFIFRFWLCVVDRFSVSLVWLLV